jgi:hypothetical protein
VSSLNQLKLDFKQKTDHNTDLIQQLETEKAEHLKEKTYLHEKLQTVENISG